MAKKNFITLKNEVLRKMGFETTDEARFTTMVEGWINEGQRHLLAQGWWPWAVELTSFSTTGGTAVYSLVATARAVRKTTTRILKANRWIPVYLVPRDKADEFLPNAISICGTPNRCWMESYDASGNWQVQLYPTPDATYTFEYGYYARVSDLSASGDTLTGPEEADEAVRDYALWKGFEHLYGETDQQAVGQARMNFERGMAELQEFIKPDHEESHFAAPLDMRDFTDTAYVDLNTSDPLDLRGA
jgi:hypothetical protein